jgi:short-subunit dehydrogenase
LRLELADTAIKVILIEPGPITSQMRNNAVPHFEKWIDWENSARRDAYQEELDRLYKETEPTKYELPPSAVTKKLLHALTAQRPKPRYFVTKPTYLMGILKRILSTRMLDAVILRG